MRSDTPSTAAPCAFQYKPPRVERIGSTSFRLTNSVVVGLPLADAFEFCRDTRFLNEISPPLLHFQPRNRPETDVKIAAGTEIEYDMRVHGVPMRWRSRIPVFDPPHRFIDQQLDGPYRSWSHTHTFASLNDHKTVIGDLVDYTIPGGPIVAFLTHLLFVERDLIKVFSHRSMKYREILGGPFG